MSFLHPVLAVPLIALIDATLAGAIAAIEASARTDSLLSPGSAAFVVFVYSVFIAFAVGCLVAWPFWKFGRRVPNPGSLYFPLIGAVFGLFLASIFARNELTFALTLTSVGTVSGILWWLLVERGRRELDDDLV